ncbi:MAG: hypothetical protein KC492_38300, partial [Myxococcales bacterium]|nr:hypothetical protein [Myxococcales bacterium]
MLKLRTLPYMFPTLLLFSGCSAPDVRSAYNEALHREKGALTDAKDADEFDKRAAGEKAMRVASAKGGTADAEKDEPTAAMPAPEDPTVCKLRLWLDNKSGNNVRMISERVCVSTTGDQLAIPSNVTLYIYDGGYKRYQVCKEAEPKVVAKGVHACTWNGTFRHAYPFSLHFDAPLGKVSDLIKAARVFLNGDLVWKWVAPADGGVKELHIAGAELRRSLLPEGAPMDLRLIPHGMEVDKAVLDAKVAEHPLQWKRQLKAATEAVETSPSFANGTLKQKLACIKYRAEVVRYEATQIAGTVSMATPEKAPTNPDPQGCVLPANPVKNSLYGRYSDLKSTTKADVDKLQQDFLAQ